MNEKQEEKKKDLYKEMYLNVRDQCDAFTKKCRKQHNKLVRLKKELKKTQEQRTYDEDYVEGMAKTINQHQDEINWYETKVQELIKIVKDEPRVWIAKGNILGWIKSVFEEGEK